MRRLQVDEYKRKVELEKAAQAQQQALRDMARRFMTPAQPGLSPLMGDPSTGMLPSAGREAKPSGFDYAGYANELAGVDPMEALKLQQSLTEKGPKFSTAPQYDQNGRAFVLAEDGTMKYLGDVKARDKLEEVRLGNTVGFRSPYSTEIQGGAAIGQSPDSRASNATSMRGQNMTDSRARERFAFDQGGGVEGVKPKLVGDQWVAAPSNMVAGEVRSAMPSVAKKDAAEALQLIKTAREIIPKSTGSYMGAGVDQVGRLFGASTGGDTAAAQLKALEGALVSKMPKMSGPQSDKDVLLYKQMAGEIGNPTIPQSRKLAALNVIEDIQSRHAGAAAPDKNTGGASGDFGGKTVVKTGVMNGRKVVKYSDGSTEYAD
jgi:hypothetical protein